jgi:predicted dehydrogenase
MAPLRVAVIGAGFFSQFHVDGWHRNPAAQLVGIADPDVGRAQALADGVLGPDHQITILTDARSLLAATSPDIIDIVTPPATHTTLIDIALETDARAIICQKPFCGMLDAARATVEKIEAQGRLCVVHENFRFQPWYRKIHAELVAGTLGDVYQATFRLRPGDGQGPNAYLARQPYFQQMSRFLVHETAIHWIDTFRYLLGEPSSIYADLRKLNPIIAGEDAGLIVLGFADGRRAVIDGNRLSDHPATNMRLTMGEALIEGSDATLALAGDGTLSLRRFNEAHPSELRSPWRRDIFGGDCAYALQAHVTAHLVTGAPIENTAAAYLRNMEIVEAAYSSARTGCRLALS